MDTIEYNINTLHSVKKLNNLIGFNKEIKKRRSQVKTPSFLRYAVILE